MRRFILLLPGETGRLPTKAASSARDKVPLPSASIAATNARTSAGEASRFVIFKPVRNISSTSWTDSSPDRSLSYLRKNRSSGREPHFALNAFRNLSCVFMSRGFLTVRLKRCVARLALVARRMVVLCCVVLRFLVRVSRLWLGRGGGVGIPVGRGQPCGARGSPCLAQKRWAALCKGDAVSRREMGDASRGGSGSVRGGASRPPFVLLEKPPTSERIYLSLPTSPPQSNILPAIRPYFTAANVSSYP